MQKPIIFIACEDSQLVAAKVLESSIRTHSSVPGLDIRLLDKDSVWPHYKRLRDPLQSTEFTFFRFCIPELLGYRGLALYLDCDMLVLGDITEVLNLDMSSHALRVVKQHQTVTLSSKMRGETQTNYYRKNWSSFMLMNCAKLHVWNWDVINNWNGLDLHQFRGIPDGLIGAIPATWNSLDYLDGTTKNIHYTSGGPWLGVYHPYGSVWNKFAQSKGLLSEELT